MNKNRDVLLLIICVLSIYTYAQQNEPSYNNKRDAVITLCGLGAACGIATALSCWFMPACATSSMFVQACAGQLSVYFCGGALVGMSELTHDRAHTNHDTQPQTTPPITYHMIPSYNPNDDL